MKIRIRVRSPYGWAILAGVLAIIDGLTWVFWREQWHNGLHDVVMIVMALIGFKLSYALGREDRKLDQITLRPGRRYRIAGPDGVWVMVGLSTGPDEHGRGQAVVTFVDEADYEARFAQKAFRS